MLKYSPKVLLVSDDEKLEFVHAPVKMSSSITLVNELLMVKRDKGHSFVEKRDRILSNQYNISQVTKGSENDHIDESPSAKISGNILKTWAKIPWEDLAGEQDSESEDF